MKVYELILRVKRKDEIKKKAVFYSSKAIEYYIAKNNYLSKSRKTQNDRKYVEKKVHEKFQAKREFKHALQ